MPWEKSYNEVEVLSRAMESFWAHGYEATSISDLVESTGINRGSINAAFKDKHELFIQALQHYDLHYREAFLNRLRSSYAPRDAIIAAFEAAMGVTEDGSKCTGCLLINTALELSPHDSEVNAIVRNSFEEVEAFFFDMVEAAQANGTVNSELDAKEVASGLLGMFFGLRVLMRSGTDPPRHSIDPVPSQGDDLLGSGFRNSGPPRVSRCLNGELTISNAWQVL